MKDHVVWTGMAAAVKEYAASCPRCQVARNNRARRADAHRLQCAMRAEPEFTASCETGVGGGKTVVARTMRDGVKLFKDDRERWMVPGGSSEPARDLRHALMQSVHE